MERTGGGSSIGMIQVLQNGNVIQGSQMAIDNVATNENKCITNSFLTTINPTGIITFRVAAGNTNVRLFGPTIAGNAGASMSMAITRVE